jgi:hypothetical protein
MNLRTAFPVSICLFFIKGRLFNADYSVLVVDENYSRIESLRISIFNVAITENDHFIADNTFPCCGTIQADLAFPAGDHIGFKPFSVVEVAHHDLFVGKYTRLFQNLPIKSETAFVGEIGLRNRRHMDLCS